VVLPKALREHQGWGPGTEFEVEPQGDGLLLRLPRPARRTTLDEVIGCIPYDGPPVSVEEMDQSVDEAARAMWDEFEDRRR
jgi:bifunctional DNA-binding transcriptional regulator/antitoxin component of YhaV-PrlF toxin-antitoxin module